LSRNSGNFCKTIFTPTTPPRVLDPPERIPGGVYAPSENIIEDLLLLDNIILIPYEKNCMIRLGINALHNSVTQ
jgi:hypothetical protein